MQSQLMRRRHRLRQRSDIALVRRQGKGVKHRLGTLVFRPNSLPHTRFCFSASKRVGNAVQRNRAKRLMREAIRLNLAQIATGWDVLLIPRTHAATASFTDVEAAVLDLLKRARLLTNKDVG